MKCFSDFYHEEFISRWCYYSICNTSLLRDKLTFKHFPTTPEQEACVPFILQPQLAVSRLFC